MYLHIANDYNKKPINPHSYFRQLTKELPVFIIPNDKSYLECTQIYQKGCSREGATLFSINIVRMIGFTDVRCTYPSEQMQ